MDMACDFPPARGYHGAASTILDLQRYYRRGIAYPSKSAACRRVMRAAEERVESDGQGNRFARRFEAIHVGDFSTTLQQDYPLLRLAHERRMREWTIYLDDCKNAIEQELDVMEFRGEWRPHFTLQINPHD
jgi:hypothetical protein